MPGLPDYYAVRARLFPAVLAVLPVLALAIASIPWNNWSLSQGVAAIFVGVVLYLAADVARRRGRAIEPQLIEEQEGLPSIAMLRHRDPTFDAVAKARHVGWLAKSLGEKAPTADNEAKDPASADAFYKRAGNLLRERTRDKKKFALLLEENITYGFRRNLYALRWPALLIDVAVVVVALAGIAWPYAEPDLGVTNRLAAVIAITVLHGSLFPTIASKRSVIEAGRQYARQLILSCEALMQASTTPSTTKKS